MLLVQALALRALLNAAAWSIYPMPAGPQVTGCRSSDGGSADVYRIRKCHRRAACLAVPAVIASHFAITAGKLRVHTKWLKGSTRRAGRRTARYRFPRPQAAETKCRLPSGGLGGLNKAPIFHILHNFTARRRHADAVKSEVGLCGPAQTALIQAASWQLVRQEQIRWSNDTFNLCWLSGQRRAAGSKG